MTTQFTSSELVESGNLLHEAMDKASGGAKTIPFVHDQLAKLVQAQHFAGNAAATVLLSIAYLLPGELRATQAGTFTPIYGDSFEISKGDYLIGTVTCGGDSKDGKTFQSTTSLQLSKVACAIIELDCGSGNHQADAKAYLTSVGIDPDAVLAKITNRNINPNEAN